jgi:hypothetical protein
MTGAPVPLVEAGHGRTCTGAADALEDPARFAAITRVDWVVSKGWNRLHALPYGPWTAEQAADIAQLWMLPGPVRLACGRTAALACIPGFGTRMSARRCPGCCRATGLPPGTGSPKNDAACRVILGLPP